MAGLGLSAAALGLPRMLAAPSARACPPTPPLRFVVFYEPNGFTHRFARPRAPGQADWGLSPTAPIPTEATGWELGAALAPLAPYQSRMISVQGMDMRSANLEQATADGGGHGHLQTHALTAAARIAHNTPGGPSIDQHIADGLARSGVLTPVHSIVTSAGLRSYSPVYRSDGTQVPVVIEPPHLYDQLFPAEFAASAEEQARARRRLTSAANHVESLSAALIRRLGGEHRRRVEEHMALHRDLQMRLAASACGSAPPRTILGPWQEPLPWINRPALESLGGSEADGWRLARDINTELTALALGADISRVAVILSDWQPYDEWGFTPDRFRRSSACDLDPDESGPLPSVHYDHCPTENDHGFHHVVDGPNHDLLPADDGQTADQAMILSYQRSLSPLRSFLDRLAGMVESDGSSVLDNTIVLLATEMGDPSHRGSVLEWSIIGDGRGRFRTGSNGRVLFLDRHRDDGGVEEVSRWSHDPAAGVDIPYGSVGPGHGGLFATLATAMGVETPSFGDASVFDGPVDLT